MNHRPDKLVEEIERAKEMLTLEEAVERTKEMIERTRKVIDETTAERTEHDRQKPDE